MTKTFLSSLLLAALLAGCGNAAREGVELEECDDNDVCQILGASFRGEAQEWRQLEDGRCICVAHVPAGQPVPPERCTRTIDMFEDGNDSLCGPQRPALEVNDERQ